MKPAVTPSAPPPAATRAFSAELAFDSVYRAHRDSHPGLREAACLAAQFPAAMSPIEPGDLLAGRYYSTPGVGKPFREHRGYRRTYSAIAYNMPALGLAALRPGWGPSAVYFFDEPLLRRKIEEADPDAATRARLDELAAYWRAEDPVKRCRAAFAPEVAAVLPFDLEPEKKHRYPAYPLLRMTGPMMDFGKLLRLGLPGLREELKAAMGEKTGQERCWLEAAGQALDVVADVARFYAAQARGLAGDASEIEVVDTLGETAAALENIAERPPENLREAAQLVLLYAAISTAYSFGRMDVYLGPFLARDLDEGRLDLEGAMAILCNLWQIIADCGAPFDNRIIVGGDGRPDPETADRFAALAIEASRRVKEPLPQLSLRFRPGESPELYCRALQALGEGRTFPMLYNDAVNVPAVASAMGVSREEAEQYVPYGCGEYVLWGQSFGTPSGVINLAKVLECSLQGGVEPATGRRVGVGGPALEEMRDFPALWRAYAENVEHFLAALAAQQEQEYDWVGREGGWLLFSMLYDPCVARGKNLFAGGLRHLGGTMESYGQINAGDSLLAIKKLVFDERRIAAATLRQALAADFEGAEDVLRLLAAAPKYGNDDAEADAMQQRVHRHVCLATRALGEKVGLDSYLVVLINNMMNTILGLETGASADGRRAGAPLANANNPAPGADRSGVTAFLNSLVKLDPAIHAGAVQNMKFGAEMFSPAVRPKLEALLGTYWDKGGSQAMITVLNRGDLEAALREPEKHHNLMVRVGGFSARFVDLPRAVQMEILHRTLH